MAQILIIRFPNSDQGDAEWQLVDDAGTPAGPVQRGPLAAAAPLAGRATKTIALAPATQILLAAPQLPPGSGPKLARAVPFALEEQLTEDVEHLSFAIGRRGAGGTTPVAVVARGTLEAWLARFAAAGIEPLALYSEASLLPENPAQTVLWLEQDRLAVRRPGTLPFVVEVAPIADALALAGVIGDPAASEPESTPRALESAILYLTREDWTRTEAEFERLLARFETLKVQLLADGPLPWLARGLNAPDAVNLLQGEYARATPHGERWREWRIAAFLGLGLLAAHVAAQAIQIHAARRESARLDAEIARVYASTMPAEPLTNARRQLQSRLKLIRAQASGPDLFLRTMQALSAALPPGAQATLESMSFHDRTLDLRLSAKSIELLSPLSQSLAARGYTTAIQSSTPGKDGVEANLRIRAPGAR